MSGDSLHASYYGHRLQWTLFYINGFCQSLPVSVIQRIEFCICSAEVVHGNSSSPKESLICKSLDVTFSCVFPSGFFTEKLAWKRPRAVLCSQNFVGAFCSVLVGTYVWKTSNLSSADYVRPHKQLVHRANLFCQQTIALKVNIKAKSKVTIVSGLKTGRCAK